MTVGLFSTKKVTSVNTSILRLIDDKNINSSIPISVISSIMQNDGQIVENVLGGLVGGLGVRAHRMYEYGKKHYAYGNPSSHILIDGQNANLVIDTVKEQVGILASIDYYKYGPLNILHKTWMTLVSDHAYLSSSNTLGNLGQLKGVPVYLQDMQVVINQDTFNNIEVTGLEQWGTPANAGVTPNRLAIPDVLATYTPYEVENSAINSYVRVVYTWVVVTPTLVEGVLLNRDITYTDSFNIPFIINEADSDSDYFQVKYTINGNSGYWLYKDGTGTLPALDSIHDTEHNTLGSFFPISYFRFNKTTMEVNPTSNEYKSSKKLVNYLSIKYADMIRDIHDNPDIADVEQAMLMFAVPANTVNQLERRYLFDFFSKLNTEKDTLGQAFISNIEQSHNQITLGSTIFTKASSDTTTRISMVIQDAKFKMVLGLDNVFMRKRVGVIAKVGEYSSIYLKRNSTRKITVRNEITGLLADSTVPVSLPVYLYQHQISEDVYEEIEVSRLQMVYHIWGEYNTIGDELDAILLIPMDYSISSNYMMADRELLYARSLHFVFNSRIITKIKWYQTGIFQVIVLIIAVVITIFTYGATWQASVAAFMALSAPAMAMAVLMAVLKYIVVSLIMRLFVKLVGVKAAFIVAIIAAVIGIYQGLDAGSIAGAPWAQELLSISTNLTSSIGDVIKDGMASLAKEAIEFGLYVDTQNELLGKANKLLEGSSILSPMIFFGEAPDDFYNRTVHSGNIGIIGLDAVSSYVDVALALPELTDTMR